MLNQAKGLKCPSPEGAFYVYPDVSALLGRDFDGSTPQTSAELAGLILEKAQVAVVPGEAFGPSGYFRLSYALGDDDLIDGVLGDGMQVRVEGQAHRRPGGDHARVDRHAPPVGGPCARLSDMATSSTRFAGIDALRGAGWRGAGPIPWSHEVNRGFLRALYALGRASAGIGESEEAARIEEFLRSSDSTAMDAIVAER